MFLLLLIEICNKVINFLLVILIFYRTGNKAKITINKLSKVPLHKFFFNFSKQNSQKLTKIIYN